MRLVTRAEWSVAREVVLGLTEDLLAQDDRFCHRVPRRATFAEAASLGEELVWRGHGGAGVRLLVAHLLWGALVLLWMPLDATF